MDTFINYLFLFSYVLSLQQAGVPHEQKGPTLLYQLQHQDTVSSVLFLPNGQLLATGCWDGSIKIWNLRTGKVDREWKAHDQGVTALAVAKDGRLASGGCDKRVRIWKDSKSMQAGEFNIESVPNSLAFSPNGNFIACGAYTRFSLWNLPVRNVRLELSDESDAVAFSPTGKLLAIGTGPGIVSMVEEPYSIVPLENGKGGFVLDKRKKNDPGVLIDSDAYRLWSVAFSPDGRTLAALGEISDLILWEVLTGKERRRLNTEKTIGFCVAISPHGNTLATGEDWCFRLKGYPPRAIGTSSSQGPACTRLWDITSGKPICRLTQHKNGTRCVAFSPDGKLLATGSEDKTALLWDVSALTRERNSKNAEPPLDNLEGHWKNLTGHNAVLAFDSILAMSASPKQSLPFLHAKLRAVLPIEKAKVESLLKDLDSDDFQTRQHASEELCNFGEGALPILCEQLSKLISAESRSRIESVIDRWKGHNPSPEILGMLRGVETLERIGSDEAVEILETLTKGVPWARQTQDAISSIKRITNRSKP